MLNRKKQQSSEMPRRAARKDGRGSRPGERRGGRKKGTPNKRTAALHAALLAEFELSGGTPLDVLLSGGRLISGEKNQKIKKIKKWP